MKKKSKKAGGAKKEKEKEKEEATTSAVADEPAPEAAVEDAAEEPSSPTQTTASLSHQSKLRSSSFRQGPLSPTLSPEARPQLISTGNKSRVSRTSRKKTNGSPRKPVMRKDGIKRQKRNLQIFKRLIKTAQKTVKSRS